MYRTIKLPYVALDPAFPKILANLRQHQSRIVRSAYCRLVDGIASKALYQNLRRHAVGQNISGWLLLSGISKAKALHRLHPEGGIVFGGRRGLAERNQGKITNEEWKSRRLRALVIEGHARSHGSQGGNYLVTLDAKAKRLKFHVPHGGNYILQLKLSNRSRAFSRRLQQLQVRCETLRDTPFSVSINETEISLSWNVPIFQPPTAGNADRILSLDLNPNRIGWTVVSKATDYQCRCVAWGIFEYALLNRRLGVPSNHATAIASRDKRRHELALVAKSIVEIARHHGAGAIVTEKLAVAARDHGRGRSFNRLINQCWFRRALIQPLLRRMEEAGLSHAMINPAYSSLMGNHLWAEPLGIPDPACAALELGRRFLYPLPLTPDTRIRYPKINADRHRKDDRRASERSEAIGAWKRVWRNLNPMARDTPRRSRKPWRPFLPSGPPRRPSVREERSHVLHLNPRSGTSDAFGFPFADLCSDRERTADVAYSSSVESGFKSGLPGALRA